LYAWKSNEQVGEPYFDINFEEVLYLTDTGRCWDGDLYNIRDKAVGARSKIQTTKGSSGQKVKDPDNQRFVWADGRNVKSSLQPSAISHQPSSPLNHHPVTPSHRRTIEPLHHFHSTFDIIYAAEAGKLPDKIMLTFHPQRWTDKPIPWMKELIWQNTKNVAKYFLIKLRK
jgi:hypothetical protein